LYLNDKEWLKDFQKVLKGISQKDETENYVEIPLNEIIGQKLDFQLEQVSIYVLGSFGLENKSRFPNSKAIRELLNERFNFETDDVIEMSPFVKKKVNKNFKPWHDSSGHPNPL